MGRYVLGTPSNAQKKQKTGNQLNSKGYNPLSLPLNINGPITGIVDPEAKHTSTLRSDLKDTNETTSNRRWSDLGNIDGHCHR